MLLENFSINNENFFNLNNNDESLSIDSFILSSTNFTKPSENDLDIFSEFLNSDKSVEAIKSSVNTSIHSNVIVNEENDKKIIPMVMGKTAIPVKEKKGHKNKIKLKLFQILLHSGATDCVVLLHLVSHFEKVNFKTKT